MAEGDAAERWLADTPWLEEGGIATVDIDSAQSCQDLVDELVNSVLRADAGRSAVEVRVLRNGDASLTGEMAASLALDGGQPRHTLLSKVGLALQSRPAVFVMVPGKDETVTTSRWLAEAADVQDTLAKLDRPSSFCLVHFRTRETATPALARSFDLRFGLPDSTPLARAWFELDELWAAYLHHRLAWESGGSIAIASDWAADLPLRFPDDNAFEAQLNALADAAWLGLPDGEREFARVVARQLNSRTGRADLDEGRVLSSSIAWLPPRSRRVRLRPWVARAMLRADKATCPVQLLRGELVCEPLALLVLAVCFELEVELRGRCGEGDLYGHAKQKAEENFASFSAREQHSASRFYPRDCPAVPRTPVAFASLGHLCTAAGRRERWSGQLDNLVAVRNAIAHGHYVGWEVIATAASLVATADGFRKGVT